MTPSAAFAFVSTLLVIGWVCLSIQRALRAAGRSETRLVWLFGAAWLAIPAAVGASGFLKDFSGTPPPMLLVLPAVLGAAIWFAFSDWGRALRDHSSMAALIGFHAFRLLPETLLVLAHEEGLAPIQMTVEGRNWDIVSAALAAGIYLRWRRSPGGVPRWAAVGFSAVGLGLLANIVGIAVLSMPTPFRVFMNEPANRFVATFPYILLPTVHVAAALAGHFLVLRKLGKSEPLKAV
jgi:hypothetical protein